MWLDCRGNGSPTVVLIAGYGDPSGSWIAQLPDAFQPSVLPAVAGFTRGCAISTAKPRW